MQKLKEGTEPAVPDNDHEPFDIIESGVLSNQLRRLPDLVEHLTSALEELGQAMEIGERDTATVYNIMGRVEAHVEILEAECLAVGAWRVSGQDQVARDLMTAICRHTLNEIRLWLEEVAAVLADPISALGKRGLGLTDQETLKVVTEPDPAVEEIRLTLKLTAAPELSALTAWMERQVRRKRTQFDRQAREHTRRERDSVGIWSFVLGALFGGWLGGWGGDD